MGLLARFAKPGNLDAALEMARGLGVDLKLEPVAPERAAVIAALEGLAQAALAPGASVQQLEVVQDGKTLRALLVTG